MVVVAQNAIGQLGPPHQEQNTAHGAPKTFGQMRLLASAEGALLHRGAPLPLLKPIPAWRLSPTS